jgi:hypothetical protein
MENEACSERISNDLFSFVPSYLLHFNPFCALNEIYCFETLLPQHICLVYDTGEKKHAAIDLLS